MKKEKENTIQPEISRTDKWNTIILQYKQAKQEALAKRDKVYKQANDAYDKAIIEAETKRNLDSSALDS